MVGGSTIKLTAAGFDRADKKQVHSIQPNFLLSVTTRQETTYLVGIKDSRLLLLVITIIKFVW
jgi:hypothetical protein